MATRVLVPGRVPWKLDLRAQQPLYALEMNCSSYSSHLDHPFIECEVFRSKDGAALVRTFV